ncbi:MAG: hypothetical protein ACR2MY_11335 [Candidatus Dormibacteria bacterium]
MKSPEITQEAYYRNIRMVPYDLIKELAIAMAAITVLVLVLAAFLSSPDVAPLTIQTWAKDDPADFVTTAAGELAGTSASSAYGPPYSDGSASVQSLGPISLQRSLGVHQRVDAANDFVIGPLQGASIGDTELATALKTYGAADSKQQGAWLDAYTKALAKAPVKDGKVVVAAGEYGPVSVLMDRETALALSGGLDGALLNSGRFYQSDFTKPLLFMADGTHLASLAHDAKLTGSQWGMMNEPGMYPGQTWLWLYTMWYQLPQFQPGGLFAANADLVIVAIMLVLSLLLLLVPYIPGIRDIPRWIPIHRLIWRSAGTPRRNDGGRTAIPVTSPVSVPVVVTPSPVPPRL